MKRRRPSGRPPHPSFADSVARLVGHVAGGAALFAGIAVVSWMLGWLVDLLNWIHPFHPMALRLLHEVEMGILYLDFILGAIVVVYGAYQFVVEIVRSGP